MKLVGAVLLGAGLGRTLGLGVGGLTALAMTVRGWPSRAVDPTDRARHLAEGISSGMYTGTIAILVAIPACTLAFGLHARRHPRV